MGDAVLVDGLVKRYGDVVAVDGLSFSVPEGRVFALLGPNGAGKTTTVECLEGLRTPDAGRVRVLGLDPVAHHGTLIPQLGVLLQGGGAWHAATPREMLRLYAAFYADPLNPGTLLERLGLAARGDDRYRTLSGGEQQRCALALALVGRPRIVVLDEPTAGLDAAARREVWRIVTELRDDGVTVLLTTHLPDEVERLADLAAVVDRGRLVALDSPAALLAGPATGIVRVSSPADVDTAALAEAIGAPVEAEAPGRWVVRADAEVIPRVAAWFAEQGLPLTGVRAGDLDDVLLRLTGGDGP